MLRSMYSGVSGLRGFQTKLDVIGNNIANVNTVGFKKSRVMFQDILSQTVAGATGNEGDTGVPGGVNPKQIGLGTQIAAIETVFSPGSPMTTNLPTDLYMEGDAFFVVSPDGGETRYLTKAGNFTRDGNGYLVNPQGYYLLDSEGTPIQIPEEAVSYSIGKDGSVVYVDEEGVANVDQTVGALRVTNPGGLKKLGNGLYELTPNSGPETTDDIATPAEMFSAINAGQLEMSNVDLAEEFTEMIVAQRGFQANSRIITTSDTILEELVNLKR